MTTRSLLAAALITLLVVARSSAQAVPTFQPPPSDEQPKIGVAYEVAPHCRTPIQVGSSWFSFVGLSRQFDTNLHTMKDIVEAAGGNN